jgi:hypothetical protein
MVADANVAAQQASRCKLTIGGGDDGMLQQAGMTCSGTPTATISLDSTYLAPSIPSQWCWGSPWLPSCESEVTEGVPCLISVCSGSMVLWDSSVSWVPDIPLSGLVCVVHDSKL